MEHFVSAFRLISSHIGLSWERLGTILGNPQENCSQEILEKENREIALQSSKSDHFEDWEVSTKWTRGKESERVDHEGLENKQELKETRARQTETPITFVDNDCNREAPNSSYSDRTSAWSERYIPLQRNLDISHLPFQKLDHMDGSDTENLGFPSFLFFFFFLFLPF